ncbi:MAG: glycosyltransferase [Chthoniobacterales bacterium]
MLLSFIVPAHNEEHELAAALAAIRAAATGRNYEIVVVDDASTDRTTKIARAAGADVVSIDRRQIAAARNAGAARARGEVLFFVDADTHISMAHVTGALEALRSGAAGGGARVSFHGEIPRWSNVLLAVFSVFYFGFNLGAGAFLFTTAENFRTVGGFDEQYFAGEEVYFSQALKKLGRFVILRQPVATSGRKLRMHSPAKIFGQMFILFLRGPSAVKTRDRLALWYDGKREGVNRR